VGNLTEGDLMRRAELVTGRRPWWLTLSGIPEERAQSYVKAHGLKVQEVMTMDVVTTDEHDPLERIAATFEARGIKRAAVMRDDRMIWNREPRESLAGAGHGEIGRNWPERR
jgi:hypothetical protein